MTTKVCRTCGVEKPIEEFRLRKNGLYRYRLCHCHPCNLAYKLAWGRAHYVPHPRPKVIHTNCRDCGIALTEAVWSMATKGPYRYLRALCRSCINANQRISEAEKREEWEEEYQAILRRVAFRDDPTPLPDSDPWLDLAVIKVCWHDCVAEGDPAIRRMVKKIIATCWAIGGQADQLHAAATGYLMGSNQLAVVAEALGDLGRLAVAS